MAVYMLVLVLSFMQGSLVKGVVLSLELDELSYSYLAMLSQQYLHEGVVRELSLTVRSPDQHPLRHRHPLRLEAKRPEHMLDLRRRDHSALGSVDGLEDA